MPYELLRTLCACALCSPTKSDLQQRTLSLSTTCALKEQILALLAEDPYRAGMAQG